MAETVLHKSGQCGFLSLSAGSVFWIVGPAIMVYFGARQLFKLGGRDGEVCHWLKMAREDCWLDSLSSEAMDGLCRCMNSGQVDQMVETEHYIQFEMGL